MSENALSNLTGAASLLRETETPTERFFKENPVGQALHAAAYSAIETPADALLQLAGKGKLGLIAPQAQAEFNTSRWYAQTAGSAVGMVVPFLAAAGTARGLGKGLVLAGESNALTKGLTIDLTNSLAMRLATPYVEAAATGAIAEGIFRPSDPAKGDMLGQRLNNAFVGAATFTTLVAGNKILKGVDAKYLSPNSPWAVNTWTHDTLRHVISGTGAGLVNAEMHALVTDGRNATAKELGQSAYTFGLLGGGFRLTSEAIGQARGTGTVSDVVSQNKGLQEVMRDSSQARSLLLDYGDVRVSKPAGEGLGSTVEPATFGQAGKLTGALALAEAQANVPRGQDWQDVLKRKLADDPASKERIQGAYNEFSLTNNLPEQNWQQSRYALVRERAVLNDWLNKNGETPTLQNMVNNWNSRWSSKVDPGQELLAKMSRTFNANDQDEAGRAQYQEQMKITSDGKTKVVADNLDPAKYQTIFDIGSAEGQVPNNIAVQTSGRTTAFAVDLDPGSFLGMLNARRSSLATGDGQFRAIPVFENGVSLKLPAKSVDVFSSLSNIHELISYPREFYGPFKPENAKLAVHNWGTALRDGGSVVIKDFLRPEELNTGKVFLVPKEVGTPANPALPTIENKPIAPEYQQGIAGERFAREFSGEAEWRNAKGQPETVRFGGKDFEVEWVEMPDGRRAMRVDARTAAELLASARYGMLEQRTQMIGATQEQFVNFTKSGWAQLMLEASPFGSKLSPVEPKVNTRAGSDYVEHRNVYFDMFDAAMQRIDMSKDNQNWHTTYQGAFRMSPGFGRGLVDFVGMRPGIPLLPLTGAQQFTPQFGAQAQAKPKISEDSSKTVEHAKAKAEN